jgi:integrase
MPRQAKGARLVWREESRKSDGSLRNRAGWFIRDGATFISGCGGTGDRERAEKALATYIGEKYQPARQRGRDPDSVRIADAINIYLRDVAPSKARPAEVAARLTKAILWFGDRSIGDINGKLCRDYADAHGGGASARRQLEDLRASINHYHSEGYCTSAPAIVLPPKPEARQRWLDRSEAAKLLWAAWRMRQSWKGQPSDRRTGRHVARFILVALYTGTRSAAICGAAIRPTEGQGYVDLEAGVFYRRAPGARQTKKRQPPVRLPDRLLAHLRRWSTKKIEIKTKQRGKSQSVGRNISHDFVVEWNGRPVTSVKKAFRSAVKAAGLGELDDGGEFTTDVTPHVFRHTAATWLMQSGTDVWAAAGFLGMTVDVLIATYGHHHPDFQAEAADAISKKAIGRRMPQNVVPLSSKQRVNTATAPHGIPTEKPEIKGNSGSRRA